jgi:DNA polymerase III epsilon subunit-like protein
MKYELYMCDTETTGLDPIQNDPIEISIYRLSTNEQKTWYLKPINMNTISADALRVNGHKIEDLKGQTKEGREKYQAPSKVLVEIENWLMEDGFPSDQKLLVGQNVPFDKAMLESLWTKCGTIGTFPFSRKYSLDTMGIELFLSLVTGEENEGYSLRNLAKKYGIKNDKAHSSESDTRTTVGVFRKQISALQSLLKTG